LFYLNDVKPNAVDGKKSLSQKFSLFKQATVFFRFIFQQLILFKAACVNYFSHILENRWT